MSIHTTPGAAGCPCEDCLGMRITRSVALAGGRDLSELRRRLDDTEADALADIAGSTS